MSPPASPSPLRRHEVDWLRAVATLAVFAFHCARPFDAGFWHLKNQERSPVVDRIGDVAVLWIMPLFFVLSGVASYHGLKTRSVGRFLRDRTLRLLVPFAFGVLVIVPPQVYIERASQGQFTGSFLEFYPHYFDGWYAFGGNFAWIGLHLWYLGLLWIITVLLAVPAKAFVSHRSATTAGWMGRQAGWLLWIGIVFAAEHLLFDTKLGFRGLGGWSVALYPIFFLCGLGLAGDDERAQTRAAAPVALLFAIAGAAALAWGIPSEFGSDLVLLIRSLASVSGLVALIGFGARLASRPLPVELGAQVMPFYVFHQTFILIAASWVLPSGAAIPLKYLLIAGPSLLATITAASLVVRFGGPLRPLFGLPAPARAPRPGRPATHADA